MGAQRFAKKTTNNVAQHVQWMRSGPSCPSDTDEQACEKPQTSILEFWSPESWLLDDQMTKCLPRLSEPGTGLHTTQPVTNIQKMLQQASQNCKQIQSYTLPTHFFGFCHANMKHVCIYMFVILFIAWLEKRNLCQRCGSTSEPGRI